MQELVLTYTKTNMAQKVVGVLFDRHLVRMTADARSWWWKRHKDITTIAKISTAHFGNSDRDEWNIAIRGGSVRHATERNFERLFRRLLVSIPFLLGMSLLYTAQDWNVGGKQSLWRIALCISTAMVGEGRDDSGSSEWQEAESNGRKCWELPATLFLPVSATL